MFLMSRCYTSIFDGLVQGLGLILPTLQMGTPYQILFWNCGHYLPTNLFNDLVVWQLMRALDSVQIAPYKLVQDSPESSLGLLTFKQPAPSSRRLFHAWPCSSWPSNSIQLRAKNSGDLKQSTSSCPFRCVSISRGYPAMSVGYSVGQFQILTLSALVSLDRHRAFVETCFNPKLAYTTLKGSSTKKFSIA